ncbi:hypothetical protein [Paraburkholderia sp. SIMBA_053]|uniref:hypothetical protein n=1 Tax=Paraburkholderia sp. SIMBA_053 TaxID=3085794 RepID=UPI003978428E
MSSIEYVEVARKAGRPVVVMGHVNVQEVVTPEPCRTARLRVFAQRVPGQPSLTFSTAMLILALVNWVARSDSALRSQLVQGRARTGKTRGVHPLFFKTDMSHLDHLEPMNVDTWHEFESHWKADIVRSLWILIEGPQCDVLKLLDAIRDGNTAAPDDTGRAHTPRLARDEAHQEAIALRNELLAKNWPDGKRVAEIVGAASRSNPHQYAARLRANAALLGVWVAAERTYRHPDFQFDDNGVLHPALADLLKALPRNEEDRNGWRRAFWLYSPHPLLLGEAPAEVFGHDPQRVVEVAREEFSGDPHAHW